MSKQAEKLNWDTVKVGSESEGPTLLLYSKTKTVEFFKNAEARKDSTEARTTRNVLRAGLADTE
jgi:hypothetical protein